jgi:hypothetical protein
MLLKVPAFEVQGSHREIRRRHKRERERERERDTHTHTHTHTRTQNWTWKECAWCVWMAVDWEQWQPSMVRKVCTSTWETSATQQANGTSTATTNPTVTMDFR